MTQSDIWLTNTENEMDKKKILYVDDEPINLNIFRINFEDEFEVLTALSGKEAYTLFNEHVDKGLAVVVTDNRMPDMSGVELMSQIFQADPDPVRIILTAFSDFNELMRAVNIGHIYQYVLKPWEYNNLRMLLKNALHTYSMIKTNKNLLLELEHKNAKLKETTEQLLHELQCRKEEDIIHRSTEAQLLHAEKLSAIGGLSASIAHEFNNPLQGVMSVIKGVKRRASLSGDDAKLVDMAINECNRMRDLIKSLQDFNRPSSGRVAPINMHDTIDSILLLSKKEYEGRGITVVTNYAEEMPLIKAVADQVKQVLLNLLNNASSACEGGGTITINTKVSKGNIAIQIQDNGQGIKTENLGHVFEPFFTTKPGMKGIGLGLSISYGIVQEHGGNIDVESEIGKGATFTVSLPIERGPK